MLQRILNPIVGLVALVLLVVFWVQRDTLRLYFGSDAKAVEPLTVGTNVWPGYEPLYLARNLGHYGSGIHMVEYSSATEVIRAFRNRLIDSGALTLDEVLLLRQSGVDLKVILVTDISDGGDVIMAKPDIETLVHLRGRRVGVESTALGAYVLTRALQTVGLTPADVQVVQIEVDGHRAAYSENRVDAVVTFEPVRSQLLNDGAGLLFDSSKIPGEIVDVVAVREDAIAGKESELQLLIDGWFKALTHLSEEPGDAGKRMASRLSLTPEEVLASFQGLKLPTVEENLAMFDETQSTSLRRTAEKLASVMKTAKLLEGDADLSSLISPQFVQRRAP